MSDAAPISILHIGKTGGSFLRSVLRHNKPRWSRVLHLGNHDSTIESTRARYGDTRELAFVIRDPLERFQSAFYSRMRQGRPTYNSAWSNSEAIAFLWFETAEELALALSGDDLRRQSAAKYAMKSIQHLNRDYRWYLGSVIDLLAERERIRMCIDLSELTARLPEVMASLGVSEFEMPKNPRRHENPDPPSPLSEAAEASLREFWAEEFELYAVARDIAGQM